MSSEAGDVRIVTAIRQGLGMWEASEAEVECGVLIMKEAERRRSCCDQPLEQVVEVSRSGLTWGLWRCTRCEETYSIGPKLPPVWIHALARACVELYRDYQAAIAAAYEPRDA